MGGSVLRAVGRTRTKGPLGESVLRVVGRTARSLILLASTCSVPRLFSAPTYRHLLSAALIQRTYLQALAQRRAYSAHLPTGTCSVPRLFSPPQPPLPHLVADSFFTARTCPRRRACSYLTAQGPVAVQKKKCGCREEQMSSPSLLVLRGLERPLRKRLSGTQVLHHGN